MTERGRVLWSPPSERVAASALTRFLVLARERSGRPLPGYAELHEWSVTDLDGFWRAVWDFCGVLASKVAALETGAALEAGSGRLSAAGGGPDNFFRGHRWFPDRTLNYAENLLWRRGPETAVRLECEDEGLARSLSWDELHARVGEARRGLLALGLRAGDRVAAFTPNVPEAVIACLAATSLGAIWSSASPDFGPEGLLDRFGQIAPRILFAADGYVYAGKRHSLRQRAMRLLAEVPSIEHVVVYPHAGPAPEPFERLLAWSDLLARGRSLAEPDHGFGDGSEAWARLPFDHPYGILFTSGTTGIPKGLVHGAGGTLLKHLAEHRLQVDIGPRDVLFYFTTCGWMMWNWLVSGLASGAAIVLYDGSPLHPDAGRLFRMVERCRVTVFGASPRFFAAVESAGLEPRAACDLSSLRTVLSTGAPLHAPQFEWIYRALAPDAHLLSISGGTDIVGCFVSGSPLHPVRAGEIACKNLGMSVEAVDDEGRPVVGQKGELVCDKPFPSMPVAFWNDPDGTRYRSAYFERFAGRWHHGDFIEFFPDGASIIHGRSDATLNPGGVRIGTAELYRILGKEEAIQDAIAVGREVAGDVRIALFVVLKAGASLDEELERRIRARIRAEASPRHVPAEIHAVREVPRTISGKPVELAVAAVLRGEAVKNREALANPEALEEFRRFARPAGS